MSVLQEVKPDLFLQAPLSSEQAIEHVEGIKYHFNTAKHHFEEASRLAWELHANRNWQAYPGHEESTWEEFGKSVFGRQRTQIHHLVSAFQVNRNLAEAGEHVSIERHARALAVVPDDLQAQVLREARATAPVNRFTGRPQLSGAHIERTAERLATQETFTNGEHLATTNKAQATTFSQEGTDLVLRPDPPSAPASYSPPLPISRQRVPSAQLCEVERANILIHFDKTAEQFRLVAQSRGTTVLSVAEFFREAGVAESWLAEKASKKRYQELATRLSYLLQSLPPTALKSGLEQIARDLAR